MDMKDVGTKIRLLRIILSRWKTSQNGSHAFHCPSIQPAKKADNMLTIHYSPNSRYPDDIPNATEMIREHGKAWYRDNFPREGDIATNDYWTIALVSHAIGHGQFNPESVIVHEYHESGVRLNCLSFANDGTLIGYLEDRDDYQFETSFDKAKRY